MNPSNTPWLHSNRFTSLLGRICLGLGIAAALPPLAPAATPIPAAPAEPPIAAGADLQQAKSLSRAFQAVAAKVEPSVVHITQFRRQEGIATDAFGNMRRIRSGLQAAGLGSGVIVSAEGHILTNNHVVGNASELKVKFEDGSECAATIVGRDPATDLAVIKVDPSKLPGGVKPVEFGPTSDELEVGEWVIAIGSPLGFSRTVTAGIVSAKGRMLSGDDSGKFEDFIQTDAAINPGNSGGPLLNLDGRLVGINTAIASRTGGSEGLGFAIPSEIARYVFENISRRGVAGRGAIGVNFGPAPASSGPLAVAVTTVLEGGPAERAGLEKGDVIVRYDGRPADMRRLRNLISFTPPGTRVTLDIVRDGASKQVAVTVGDMESVIGIVQLPTLGLEVQNLPGRGRDTAVRGVGVRFADQNGRGSQLEVNDVIVGIQTKDDRRPRDITNAKQLQSILEKVGSSEPVRIFVNNGRRNGFIDIDAE